MVQVQVTFKDAIERALKYNYCNFDGRASRSEYWWFALFSFIVGAICELIPGTTGSVIGGIVNLALLLPSLGLVWRRLHDMGRAGGWFFIAFIPLVGWIFLLVWLVQPSQPEANRFGDVPNVI